MARTKQIAKKTSTATKASKNSTPKKGISSDASKKTKTTSSKENVEPNENDDNDFEKSKDKKLVKKVKPKEDGKPKKKKTLQKKKNKDDEIESDPETNDIEAVIELNYLLGNELLHFNSSTDVLNFANTLFENTFLETTRSQDEQLISLFSIFKNCLGCKFYETLNANSFFTELFQKFEEIIESEKLTKAASKKVGLEMIDLIEDCGHYNKGKCLKDLNIDEDFESICKRLMSAAN